MTTSFWQVSMETDATHYETLTGFTPLSTLGPYRAVDYWKLPEGDPVELIYGRLILCPRRDVLHQTAVGLLSIYLLQIARRFKGFSIPGPVDIPISDHSILQPDVLYIRRDRRRIVADRIEGPPDLIVEVVMPNNKRRDRVDKLSIYAQYGVAEYWIVDPAERQFDFLVNRGGKFEIQPQQDNRYASPVCPELEIDLTAFWRSVDEELGSD